MKTVLIVLLILLCAVLIGRQVTLERGLHRAAHSPAKISRMGPKMPSGPPAKIKNHSIRTEP